MAAIGDGQPGFLAFEQRQLSEKADSVLVGPNRQSVTRSGLFLHDAIFNVKASRKAD